ncbi:hypothetical protein NPIL_220421 [Nephila pilipes]|uniref:Uncharacterized protein n=1 Tax=Nephila pilipes TaxID=299642 RepID=A0A8X6PNH3_NEPPI|nr:hypothetical protein NPIL_220421 [Nephila pilipes]
MLKSFIGLRLIPKKRWKILRDGAEEFEMFVLSNSREENPSRDQTKIIPGSTLPPSVYNEIKSGLGNLPAGENTISEKGSQQQRD